MTQWASASVSVSVSVLVPASVSVLVLVPESVSVSALVLVLALELASRSVPELALESRWGLGLMTPRDLPSARLSRSAHGWLSA